VHNNFIMNIHYQVFCSAAAAADDDDKCQRRLVGVSCLQSFVHLLFVDKRIWCNTSVTVCTLGLFGV
jgi:hypothetical protein